VEQTREPMEKNRIVRRERRTSGPLTAKSISIKGAERKSGGCARKAVGLTSGDLCHVSDEGLGEPRGFSNVAQESAEGVLGLRCQTEGPNGAPPTEG
jgi:hypothetical protein